MKINLEKICIGFFIGIMFFCICNKIVEGMAKQLGSCCWPGQCSKGLTCSFNPTKWAEADGQGARCNYAKGLPFFSGVGKCVNDT